MLPFGVVACTVFPTTFLCIQSGPLTKSNLSYVTKEANLNNYLYRPKSRYLHPFHMEASTQGKCTGSLRKAAERFETQGKGE